MKERYTIEEIKAMSDDRLTNFSGIIESAGSDKGYFYICINLEDGGEIITKSEYEDTEFEAADTPEFYTAWEARWDDMVADLRNQLN